MTNAIGRRDFVRIGISAGLLRAVLPDAVSGLTGDVGLRIGVVLPAADPALRGTQLGALEAEHAARLFRTDFTLRAAAPATDGDQGAAAAAAATRLLRELRPHALIGGAGARAADALARMAGDSGVLFMNVGTPREALEQRCQPLIFHIRPGNRMRTNALAAAAPVATADARALSWHPSLSRFGAGQVIDRFERAFSEPMTEGAWEGWMAVKILFDASQRARTVDPTELAHFLASERAVFDGHKGLQLSFHPVTHQLRQPLYIVAGGRVVHEVPTTRDSGDVTHAELLDTMNGGGEPCAL